MEEATISIDNPKAERQQDQLGITIKKRVYYLFNHLQKTRLGYINLALLLEKSDNKLTCSNS